jgi:hypothetical protein
MDRGYEVVIGLEVHVELKTATKIFCSCSTAFGAEPNTQVCPVCSGFPGALPVLNRQAVEYAIRTGLALNCEIAETCKFDRKNYFYPDLPRAYQISQYDQPICKQGYLDIDVDDVQKRIGITRAHLEEDAGKLIHQGSITTTTYSRGSVIRPVSMEAATVAGEARYIKALLLPMRPLKLRLAVEITFSPSDGTPLWVPTQGPQPGVTTAAPASTKVSIKPSRMACK